MGAFVEKPGPLSTEASECIRTASEGIDLLSVWLAATQDNELDYTLLSGVFATVACLNYEEWETAAKVLDLNPVEREITVCLMGEMGRTRGLTAALEAKNEGGNIALLAGATGCELEVEPEQPAVVPTATPVYTTVPATATSTPVPTRAAPTSTTTLVITVAPIPADIPEYDRSQWKHWTDQMGTAGTPGRRSSSPRI